MINTFKLLATAILFLLAQNFINAQTSAELNDNKNFDDSSNQYASELFNISPSMYLKNSLSKEINIESNYSLKNILPETDGEMDRTTFDIHRILGYSILVGAIASSITGPIILNKYDKNERPSEGLRGLHSFLGSTTFLLSLVNSTLGFINYNKLESKQIGIEKRSNHRWWSLAATLGFTTTAIFGNIAAEKYEKAYHNAQNTADLKQAKLHAGLALTSSVLTTITVAIIIW